MYKNKHTINLSVLRLLQRRYLSLGSESGSESGSGSLVLRPQRQLLYQHQQQRLPLLLFQRPLRLGGVGHVCGHVYGYVRGHERERSRTSTESPDQRTLGWLNPLNLLRGRLWLLLLSLGFVSLGCSALGAHGMQSARIVDSFNKIKNRSQQQQQQQQIDLSVFHPFEIVAKERVSSTCSIFTLESQSQDTSNPYHELLRDTWAKGVGVWSVQIKQPQLQIARSYTPLPPLGELDGENGGGDDSTTELRFLIRHEPQGEVSGYLHSLPLGATVHIRGLDIEYEVPSNIDEILFLAGGTGIAPALQVAHCLLERRRKSLAKTSDGSRSGSDSSFLMPKMHILWANRKREDAVGGVSSTSSTKGGFSAAPGPESWSRRWRRLFFAGAVQPTLTQLEQQPPRDASPLSLPSSSSLLPPSPIVAHLDHLTKHEAQDHITLDYFIDEEGSRITPDLLRTYLLSSSSSSNGHEEKEKDRKNWQQQHQQAQAPVPTRRALIMISGPDGFVAHHAGPKVWIAGKHSQGRLGGVLGGLLGSVSAGDSSEEEKEEEGEKEKGEEKKDKQKQKQHWDIWKL